MNSRASLEENLELAPVCDVEESKTHYLISLDLPGVKKNDVKIELRNDRLIVSGERKKEKDKNARAYQSRTVLWSIFAVIHPSIRSERRESGGQLRKRGFQIAIPKTEVSVGKQIPIKKGKLIDSKGGKAA